MKWVVPVRILHSLFLFVSHWPGSYMLVYKGTFISVYSEVVFLALQAKFFFWVTL
jgi:hypothetical protein